MSDQFKPLDEEEKERIDARMDGSLEWSNSQEMVPSHFGNFSVSSTVTQMAWGLFRWKEGSSMFTKNFTAETIGQG